MGESLDESWEDFGKRWCWRKKSLADNLKTRAFASVVLPKHRYNKIFKRLLSIYLSRVARVITESD